MEPELDLSDQPNGPVAAAMLAGGLGCATIGVLTVLGESLPGIGCALNWWDPAGPLVGKAIGGVAVFFLSWVLLHLAFRHKSVPFVAAATIALLLVAVGLLATFPPFFDLFVAK